MTDLLKVILDVTSEQQKNAQDKQTGFTALHVLVATGRINSNLGETIIRLMLNNGCRTDIRDKQGCTAKQYLTPNDQGYILIQAAEKKEGTCMWRRYF